MGPLTEAQAHREKLDAVRLQDERDEANAQANAQKMTSKQRQQQRRERNKKAWHDYFAHLASSHQARADHFWQKAEEVLRAEA